MTLCTCRTESKALGKSERPHQAIEVSYHGLSLRSITREIFVALGRGYEHHRHDRDDYVWLNMKEVIPGT